MVSQIEICVLNCFALKGMDIHLLKDHHVPLRVGFSFVTTINGHLHFKFFYQQTLKGMDFPSILVNKLFHQYNTIGMDFP